MPKTSVHLVFLILWIVLPRVSSQEPARDNEDPSEEPYASISTDTTLNNFVARKQWLEAHQRLLEAPDEASVLIEQRNTRGKVIARYLPLHVIFAVDVPQYEGTVMELSGQQMSNEQAKLVLALLKTNPQAATLKDMRSRLPLHLALYSANPPPTSVLSALLDANPDAIREKDVQGRLPLHAATTAPLSPMGNVEFLVKAYPDALEVADQDGSLPIHTAAWGGNMSHSLSVIRLLLSSKPETLSALDDDDETPLIIMAKYGHTSDDAVRYFVGLDEKAAFEYRDETEGNTLLHFAVSASATKTNNTIYDPFLDTLPQTAKLINRVGQLPIHTALSDCCAPRAMIEALLKAYPRGAYVRDGFGFLPLHYSCQTGVMDTGVVDLLLESNPGSANYPTSDGHLALHLALNSIDSSGQDADTLSSQAAVTEEVILRLVKAFPGAAKVKDPMTNHFPLYAAIKGSAPFRILSLLAKLHPQAICQYVTSSAIHALVEMGPSFLQEREMKELLEELLNLDPTCCKRTNESGSTPLHSVWRNPINETTFRLQSRGVVVDTLLDANSEGVHALDKEGKSPLFAACLAHDGHAVESILDHYPLAAQIRSLSASLPLHDACSSNALYPYPHTSDNNHKIITGLLDVYPQAASMRDDTGELPLHKICSSAGRDHFGNETIRSLIQAYPPSVETTNTNDNLPLHIAVQEVRECTNSLECFYLVETVRLLLEFYPEGAAVPNHRGNTALAILLSDLETLSSFRRDNDDPILQTAKLLYPLFPDSVKERNARGWSVLHRVATLVGDLGGSIPEGWASFIVTVMQDHHKLLSVKDRDQRTPLHLLLLNLGDTAMGARQDDNNEQSRDFSPHLEKILYTALALGDASILQEREEYGLTPMDMITHERLKKVLPETYSESIVIQKTKLMLERGTTFWKLAGELNALPRKPMDCSNEMELSASLSALEEKISLELATLGVQREEKNVTGGEQGKCVEEDGTCSRIQGETSTCASVEGTVTNLSKDLALLERAIDEKTMEEVEFISSTQ